MLKWDNCLNLCFKHYLIFSVIQLIKKHQQLSNLHKDLEKKIENGPDQIRTRPALKGFQTCLKSGKKREKFYCIFF